MELTSDEIAGVKTLLADWHTDSRNEVEATFGYGGTVDVSTFLRVYTRLLSKGWKAVSQQDRLTISLQNDMRFTLSGAEKVSLYCRDNIIVGRPFTVMIKNKNVTTDENKRVNLDIGAYDLRIKARREEELNDDDRRVQEVLSNWPTRRKYFRLIRRWSFVRPGVRIDMSMVRSSKPGRDGKAWQRMFGDQPIVDHEPSYEIEVELDHSTFEEGGTIDDAFKMFIGTIGEILRGIQGCPVLIRKEQKVAVLDAYKTLTKTTKFRGAKLKPLLLENMTTEAINEPNIRSGYNATDKADGLRVHAFTNEQGELFMIDMNMNVYRTGLVQQACRNALLDGEYVTLNKQKKAVQQLLLFDIYYAEESKDVSQQPFAGEEGRHALLEHWLDLWNEGTGPIKKVKNSALVIQKKVYFFADEEDPTSIFGCCAKVLDNHILRDYPTDGIILTPNKDPLPTEPFTTFQTQFKWKPAIDNTVDFLVSFEKAEEDESGNAQDSIRVGIHPETGATVKYKTLRLYVSTRDNPAYLNPRETILYEKAAGLNQYPPGKLKPVLFTPIKFPDPMANVCFLEVELDNVTNEFYVKTSGTEEPIRDRSIVEMRYDPSKPAGWRWIPTRVRIDKTERIIKGRIDNTLNAANTAESIWNSIHEPITESMIRTGAENPTEAEMAMFVAQGPPRQPKKYYERKAAQVDLMKTKPMRNFHNFYIKEKILYRTIGTLIRRPSILDMAVGRANDINRWIDIGASFVLGVDATGECCYNAGDSAYRTYLQTLDNASRRGRADNIPPMFFVVADSSRRLKNGEAVPNNLLEDQDMLRSILGTPTVGPVPPAVTKRGKDILAEGADVLTCMHALHYFFATEETLNGFLANVAENLKIGGLFVGTNFDGKAVFDELRGIEKGRSKSGVDGATVLWEITKQYDAEELPRDASAFGMKVDVNFISIGKAHSEFLVPWELFVEKMRLIGCELLPAEDLRRVGLRNATNLYSVSYDMAMRSPEKERYRMTDAAQRFSFLNRWYIFKRTSIGVPGGVEAAGIGVMAREEEGAAAGGGEGGGAAEAAALGAEVVRQSAMASPSAFVRSTIPGGGAAAASAVMARANALAGVAEGALTKQAAAQKLAAFTQRVEQVRGDAAQMRALNAEAAGLYATDFGGVAQLVASGPAGGTAHIYMTALRNAAGLAPLVVEEPDLTGEVGVSVAVDGGSAAAGASGAAGGGGGGAAVGAVGAVAGGTTGLAVPGAVSTTRTYPKEKVVQFYERSDRKLNNVRLPEKYETYAGRILAPNAPFRIRDRSDPADDREYPSITHFLVAMKFKYASTTNALATMFSVNGSIHQRFLAERETIIAQRGKLTSKQQQDILINETEFVIIQQNENLSASGFQPSEWMRKKTALLQDAILQRLTADKVFCAIVHASLAQGMVLVYKKNELTIDAELGATYRADLKLSGENRYGQAIMDLAAANNGLLTACLALPDPA
jgi:hypothetical protein